jgi:uncharacterized protein (TIGR03435 family)
MRLLIALGLLMVGTGTLTPASLAQTSLAFEVASVRENTSASSVSSNSGPRPGRFTITNTPLRFIVLEAFGLLDHQLLGAPEWTNTASFDITAAFPQGSVPERDWRPMLQRVLIDRFGLTVHREIRVVPTYELVLARKDGVPGPQLVRTDGSCEKPPACTLLVFRQGLTARTQAIQKITPALQSLTGRPVVDRTGLTGTFDIDLKWSASGDDGPSIFTALQEQTGLRLEPSKGPFEVVVIDKVARPTPD